MRLFVASVVCVLLALNLPDIDSKLDKFTECKEFFFKEKPPVIPNSNNYKTICQTFKNQIRFATLYDTARRSPLFSAYKYTGYTKINEPQSLWMAEKQLEPLSDVEMREPFVNQARNVDYMRNNPNNYIIGALFPTSHTADKETQRSTLTLTNSVPLNNMFKESIWNLVETEINNNMDNKCRDNNQKTLAYVLTGVIPGNQQLNERVNVPSHVWTAFCCYDSLAKVWVSKTYFTSNQRHESVNKIKLKDLLELKTFLNERLAGEVELFDDNCNKK
ncbi:endonuclease domain-containing 1 protein-like [Triplophysa dalaica]|uniref:endonuclease domain-containing 1 protein-like n=1 Tax=Triplophysa dalaica TaxID=1582913 RepID=UPI0024DFAD7A|nr:endonuclease domain-containing 1 protein-like [Triplophysa dalaica]